MKKSIQKIEVKYFVRWNICIVQLG